MSCTKIIQKILPERGLFLHSEGAAQPRSGFIEDEKMKRLLTILSLIASTGCSTDGLEKRIIDSAHNAFFNPNTLVPLVGASVFYAVDDFDEKVSHWATKHHPVYGSSNNAKDASNSIKNILELETYITALAVPDDKLKRIGIEWATLRSVHSATSFLKQETNRVRPNGENDLSFPSACTSFAFSSATLSNRNLDYIDMDWPNFKRGLQFGNICLASSVAWARVERGAHYPSDVLAGAALGNFMSAFIYDAFFGVPEKEGVNFSVVPSQGGAMAQLSFKF